MARHFLRHFLEMALAMLLGMAAAEPLVRGLTSEMPALAVLVMALAMTAPMAAWMRFRGHGWARVAEMSAAMVVPAVVLAGLLAAGMLEDGGAALHVQHGLMFPAMLAVMRLRRDEYARRPDPLRPCSGRSRVHGL